MQGSKPCALPLGDTPKTEDSIVTILNMFEIVLNRHDYLKEVRFLRTAAYFAAILFGCQRKITVNRTVLIVSAIECSMRIQA